MMREWKTEYWRMPYIDTNVRYQHTRAGCGLDAGQNSSLSFTHSIKVTYSNSNQARRCSNAVIGRDPLFSIYNRHFEFS